MDSWQEFGIRLVQALQSFSPALDRPMGLISFMGTIEFYLIFIPLIYWTISPQFGMRLLLLLIGTDIFGSALKQLAHQPRPYWLNGVKSLALEPSYGIPSTHASDSLAVWGYLALIARRRWIWLATAVLVLMIGLSRLYLGVHFPLDVIGGWLLGGWCLALFVANEQRIARWWRRLATGVKALLGFGASVAVIGGGLAVVGLIGSVPDPAAWSSFASEARSPSHYFTLAGALFGAVAGYPLMQRYAPFHPGGSTLKRGLRYFVGIIGVLIVWRGLDAAFALLAPEATLVGLVLRYVRYAATTGFAIFGAPWLFVRTKLAAVDTRAVEATVDRRERQPA